mmetsp:Transcript_34593/g.91015  ORF Transcript_34593/g.91015 Transcript_34593/m.91015 type:complete len:245 (+) Transcript_34593:154-888(+)
MQVCSCHPLSPHHASMASSCTTLRTLFVRAGEAAARPPSCGSCLLSKPFALLRFAGLRLGALFDNAGTVGKPLTFAALLACAASHCSEASAQQGSCLVSPPPDCAVSAGMNAASARPPAIHGLIHTSVSGSSIDATPSEASRSTSRSHPIKSTPYESASAVATSAIAKRAVPSPPSRSRLGKLMAGAASKKANARPAPPPAFWMPAARVTVECSHSCSGTEAASSASRAISPRTPLASPALPEA